MPQGDFLTGDRDRDRRNVDMLLAAVEQMVGRLGVEETLREAVDGAIRVTGGERGFLLLGDDEGALRVRVARHKDGRDLDGVTDFSHSATAKVWTTGKPEIRTNTADLLPLTITESMRIKGLRSVLAVPLPGPAGRPTGVLYVDSQRKASGFSPGDRAVFESLAVLASTAIRRAEAEEVERELEAAREIQARMAPKDVALPAGFDLASVGRSAVATSGDYHDVIPLEGGAFCLVVGDVVGHGLGAALHMASVRAALRTGLRTRRRPLSALADLHTYLCGEMHAHEFMTMALVVVDPVERAFRWVSAGQTSLLWRRGEGVRELRRTGPPLAAVPEARFHRRGPVAFEPGDALVLYTDGITEAFDRSRTPYGDDRFQASLASHAEKSDRAKPILDGLISDLFAFVGGPAIADDVTCVVLRTT